MQFDPDIDPSCAYLEAMISYFFLDRRIQFHPFNGSSPSTA